MLYFCSIQMGRSIPSQVVLGSIEIGLIGMGVLELQTNFAMYYLQSTTLKGHFMEQPKVLIKNVELPRIGGLNLLYLDVPQSVHRTFVP